MKSNWDSGLRILTLLGWLFGACGTFAQVSVPEEPKRAVGPTVVALRLVKEDGREISRLPEGLPVEVGKPLDAERVAAAIRVLYQTGNYADLRAVTYPEQGGVRLEFVATENLFINQVIIEGLTPPPSDSSAAAAMQLSLGQTYHEADVVDGTNRLRDALREEGLYQAKLEVEKRARTESRQLDVIVHVNSGPRVRLSKIDLLNNTEYRDGDLLSLFRVKTGRELT